MEGALAGPQKWDLIIVGSGAGGLVLALELAKKGFRIAILDRQPHSVSLPRGEIIQPNGLGLLDRLGLLSTLLESDVYRNERVDFYQASGPLLCAVDYRVLPPPYAYSLILLPEVAQKLLLEKVAQVSNISFFWGATFRSLIYEGSRLSGLEAEWGGERTIFRAPVVVGGDGARSALREALRIPCRLHRYVDGYLTMVVDRPPGFEGESRYYLGRRALFGAFPVSKEKLYLFYMVPSHHLESLCRGRFDLFKESLLSFHPSLRSFLEGPLKEVSSWEETSYMPCFRVRCDRWVADGAALMGDAAHAMNPHVAQGRNTAMNDGVVLAEVLEGCFRKGDFSTKALSVYESRRRPPVEALQRLGDELTWLWNSGFPPLVWARDRIFRSIHRKQDLHDKILMTISGLKEHPFGLIDRWRALHLWGGLLNRSEETGQRISSPDP
ncbi:MAG: FAD-dependent monooxygenase [Candidatus Manganitrophaceae bacterium]|nr:MAG: FAD-dependent monooxygenase [Candidatus Manganitrophaceae bacterium]